MQELGGDALAHAGLSADGKFLAFTGTGAGDFNATLASTVVDVAKIPVGKLPKFPSPQTHVWQLDVN